jgi:hypothetical protein
MMISSTSFSEQDRLEPLDQRQHLAVLGDDLVALERGQALQPHVQNRLRLQLRQAELLHQCGLRARRVGRLADRRDHLVEVVERDHQPLEDVGPLLGPRQLVARPPRHHLLAVLEEVLEHRLERQHARLTVDDRQEGDAERRLHRRQPEQPVHHHLGDRVALQFDDDADPVTVGLVTEVGHPLQFLGLDQLGDPFD